MSASIASNRFIIISGPPGAGKTTVARHIVSTSPTPIAYIEGDIFWSFLPKQVSASADASAARHGHKIMAVIIKAMTLAALPISKSVDVIVDFSIAPWHLPYLPPTVKGLPIDYIIICPSESVCAQRTSSRVQGRVTDYTRFHDFHHAFMTMNHKFQRHVIHDDSADVPTMAARIQQAIITNTYRLDMMDVTAQSAIE